jgi:tripartite-type tricarboxylate transporter receptor subunit TctC
MASRLGLKMTHIPFRGGSEFIAALLAGTVDLGVQALPTVRALARDGKLKILAVASAKRSKLAPDLPTMEEFGVRDMDFPGAIGILAPKATPPDVVAQRAKAMNTAVTGPAVVEKLATYAIEPTALTPQEFGDWIARDIVKFRDAVASAGLMPQ